MRQSAEEETGKEWSEPRMEEGKHDAPLPPRPGSSQSMVAAISSLSLCSR